jgi:ferredoxin
MPWILKKKCISCKKCVKRCPVDGISMSKGKAVIDDHICIYCGKCVKVCPVNAILKDREKVKQDVETNIRSFQKKMKKHKDSTPQSRMLKGEIKRLEMQKKIIQGTLRKLKSLKP